jgi:hypothetical protein
MRLQLEVSLENGMPQIDTASLTAFVRALIPDQAGGLTKDFTPDHARLPRLGSR